MVLSALHLGFLILVQRPYCVGYLMCTSVGRPFCCSGECSWLRKSNRSIYGHVTKWRHWGIFKHWGSKLPFPSMLCKSDCHRHSFYRGSDASTRPSQWLGIIGGLCQVLEAHKISHLQDVICKENIKRHYKNIVKYSTLPAFDVHYLVLQCC